MNNAKTTSFRWLARRWLLGLSFCTLSCSEATNPLGLIAKSWVEGDAAALYSRSQILLDEGEYQAALEAVEKAYELAPLQARIATQLSYAHLAVAGLDLFQLAKKMVEKGEKAEENPEAPAETGLLLAEENAAGQLSSLADLVGLQSSDYEAITLPGNRLGELEGAPSSGPFRDLPVLLPKTAAEARASDSPTFIHIVRAVEVLCGFMPDEVKILGDSGDLRHIDASCERGERTETRGSKAFFVWAIAHLIEAVAFHQVVLYQPQGDTPNLQQRSQALGQLGEGGSITEYVAAVSDLAAVVDVVMPVSPEQSQASMLTAMFNDLETVSRTFSLMDGIPESLSGGIIRGLNQLKAQKEGLNQGASSDGNSVVLKDQLTSGLATELKKQIESKEQAGQLSEKEKTDVCDAYKSISSEALSLCTGT